MKNKVSKMEFFTNKMESVVWASNSQTREPTYAFSQLRQWIKHLENLDNKRSGREGENLLQDTQWMGGSQEKGEIPRCHRYIETTINKFQDRLNSNENYVLSFLFWTGLRAPTACS